MYPQGTDAQTDGTTLVNLAYAPALRCSPMGWRWKLNFMHHWLCAFSNLSRRLLLFTIHFIAWVCDSKVSPFLLIKGVMYLTPVNSIASSLLLLNGKKPRLTNIRMLFRSRFVTEANTHKYCNLAHEVAVSLRLKWQILDSRMMSLLIDSAIGVMEILLPK